MYHHEPLLCKGLHLGRIVLDMDDDCCNINDNEKCNLITLHHSSSVPYCEMSPAAFEAGTCEGLPPYGRGIHIESGSV